MRPIKDADDPRLIQCEHVLQWFLEWEKYNNEKCDGPKARIEKSLISYQTREDIFSLLKGFQEFVKERFRTCKTSVSIIPGRINSDVIENVFCQMRGMKNGANTNPNYLGYCRSVNAIILGQTTVSRKSNTGGEGAHHVSSSSIVVPAKIPKVCQDRILQPVSLRGNLQN
ncbi:hypothetical protein FSP39_021984 [Pinctada imbricata]|nr:hypothetical protein FSP39_021984 [Pinctada imbricata]